MKDWILNAYSNIGLDCYWQIHYKDTLKKTFSESIFDLVNCHWIVQIRYVSVEFILLLHEINTNKYLKWTGKPKFRLRNLGKQIDWFICLLPGHIMTSIVKIQLVRLLAPLTSFNRKSSKLQQDAGYPLKTILLRWLFMDALN